MTTVQTAYADRFEPFAVGQVANLELCNTITKIVKVGALPFGSVAVRGANDDEARTPDASNVAFLGIVFRDRTVSPDNPDSYAIDDPATIVEKGVIAVTAGAAVTAGQAAYFTDAGVITNVATDNNAIPNATFDTSGASGSIVVLRLK